MEVTSKEMSKNNFITNTNDLDQNETALLRPILIGYAFGPKKMKTMAKVMDLVSEEVTSVTAERLLEFGKMRSAGLEDEDNYVESVVVQNSKEHVSDSVVGKGFLKNISILQKPVKVSFVPLNLDIPLKQQHGGNFDVILHKMTEDILYISSIKSTNENLENGSVHRQHIDDVSVKQVDEKNAIRRINQLKNYSIDFPSCSLINHPNAIQKLMCRTDTSRILSECLVNVTSKSGISIRTPQFIVVNDTDTKSIAQQIDSAPFTYPFIAKPVPAAGTVDSHKMVIIRHRDGFDELHPPYLLQEYLNHGGKLYKVYVMGDNIWIFARPSLPDLPRGEFVDVRNRDESFLCFDSQKPYPCISDFNLSNDDPHGSTNHYNPEHNNNKSIPLNPKEESHIPDEVTSSELEPIVRVLRDAFSIDLFGFDILISSGTANNEGGSNSKELLVVDVNYFPSYKEIPNFHSILAQYLLQRGMEGRLQSLN